MSNYKLVSMSGAVEGKDVQFVDWYTEEHVKDVLKVPGVRSVRLSDIGSAMGNVPWQLMAEFDVDNERRDDIIPEIQRRIEAGEMALSDTVNMSAVSLFIASARSR